MCYYYCEILHLFISDSTDSNEGLVDVSIIFCAGTAGELIKLYPVINRIEAKSIAWTFLFTGQSPVNFMKQWDDFRLPKDKIVTLVTSLGDLQTSVAAVLWFCSALTVSLTEVKSLVLSGLNGRSLERAIILVHGDTLSTLVGALVAKRMGIKTVGHIEAGLRSRTVFAPFPEELTRRAVSRLVNLHFPQDDLAKSNLVSSNAKGNVVSTQFNTLLDAVQDIESDIGGCIQDSAPCVVANLHRYENLNSRKNWSILCDVVLKAAEKRTVYFVQHPPTKHKLNTNKADRERLVNAGVQLLDRLPFTFFIKLLSQCDFVISDGGSNQEECFYLGKPCLILRDSTERVEGLASNCVLSNFSLDVIDAFLDDPLKFKRNKIETAVCPSDLIVENVVSAIGTK